MDKQGGGGMRCIDVSGQGRPGGGCTWGGSARDAAEQQHFSLRRGDVHEEGWCAWM